MFCRRQTHSSVSECCHATILISYLVCVRKYTNYGCQKLCLLPGIYHAHPHHATELDCHRLPRLGQRSTVKQHNPGVPAFQNGLREVVLRKRKQVQKPLISFKCWRLMLVCCNKRMQHQNASQQTPKKKCHFRFCSQKSRVEAWLVTTVNPEPK